MTTPNIATDTTPVLDPDHPGLARSAITDAWGLVFAQGGVVMAAALRAMNGRVDGLLVASEHVHVRAVFRRLRFPTGQVRGESNLGSLDCETFRLMPC